MVTRSTKIIGKPDLHIDELIAIVALDENGDEGILGASMMVEGQLMMVPFVGADEKRVRQLIPKAQELARLSGTDFRIYRFRGKEDVTEEFLG